MKRMICLFVIAGLIAGGAIAADVPSVNAVGYQTVDIVDGFNMLAYSWNDIGGTNKVSVQNLLDISNLKKGSGFKTSDNLYLWDKNTQTYLVMILYDGSTSYWDGKWLLDGEIATNMVSSGEGFWLRKIESNVTVQVSGQVPNGSTSSHTFAGDGKFTMFGSAYSADVAVNSMGLTNGSKGYGFKTSDNLYLWDKNTQTYLVMILYDGSTSYWDGKWLLDGEIATNVLHMGEGAWYRRKPGTGDLDWDQTRPYTLD